MEIGVTASNLRINTISATTPEELDRIYKEWSNKTFGLENRKAWIIGATSSIEGTGDSGHPHTYSYTIYWTPEHPSATKGWDLP